MVRMRKLSGAAILAIALAAVLVTSSARLKADDGTTSGHPVICAALDAAEAAAAKLPDGKLKTAILNAIEASEAKWGCE